MAGKRELDVWESLAKIRVPTLIVRGLKSDRWPPEILARVQRDFPKFEWATADSFHDVAYYAPAELVAAVRKFVG